MPSFDSVGLTEGILFWYGCVTPDSYTDVLDANFKNETS